MRILSAFFQRRNGIFYKLENAETRRSSNLRQAISTRAYKARQHDANARGGGKRSHRDSDKRGKNERVKKDVQRPNSRGDSNKFRSVRFSGPIKLDPSVLVKNDISVTPEDTKEWDMRDEAL